jgi:riboflavin biosynthesis pyrimidine reductase
MTGIIGPSDNWNSILLEYIVNAILLYIATKYLDTSQTRFDKTLSTEDMHRRQLKEISEAYDGNV